LPVKANIKEVVNRFIKRSSTSYFGGNLAYNAPTGILCSYGVVIAVYRGNMKHVLISNRCGKLGGVPYSTTTSRHIMEVYRQAYEEKGADGIAVVGEEKIQQFLLRMFGVVKKNY